MDSPSSPDIKDSGSPKKLKVEERSFWLEHLFVKTPKHTFQAYKDKFDNIMSTIANASLLADSFPSPKETLAHVLEKLAYSKLFLETSIGRPTLDVLTKGILEQNSIMKFDGGEFQFLEGYDHYFATCFITNNISENIQQVLLQNIFKPENSVVKFFINKIAEKDRNDPLYKMWDNVLYSKIFLTAGTDTLTVEQEYTSEFEIRAVIHDAMSKITSVRPEDMFNCVQKYLDLCKKYNQLDLKAYEAIIYSLLYKLVAADLRSTNVETSHEKLLRYRTFYKSLLLKTVYFKTQTGLTGQERLITSRVEGLIEDVKLEVDDVYSSSNKDFEWLERDGIYLASLLEHLTPKMVLKYMSVFYKLPYEGGHRQIYAERIYTYFIKPLLNSTADKGTPGFDQAEFLQLFVPVTQYMHDVEKDGISHSNHITKKEVFLTENEWKGLRIWLDNSEDMAYHVNTIVAPYEKDRSENSRGVIELNGVEWKCNKETFVYFPEIVLLEIYIRIII